MKKKLLSVCLFSGIIACTSAQTNVSHWSVGANGGLDYYRVLPKANSFINNLGWNAGVELEYSLNKIIGFGLDGKYLSYNRDFCIGNAYEAALYSSFNLSNLLFVERSNFWQGLNIYGNLGLGASAYHFSARVDRFLPIVHNNRDLTPFGLLGLSADVYMGKNLSLILSGQYRNYTHENMGGAASGQLFSDAVILTAGVRVKFATKDSKHLRNNNKDDKFVKTVYVSPFSLTVDNANQLASTTSTFASQPEDFKVLSDKVDNIEETVEKHEVSIKQLEQKTDTIEVRVKEVEVTAKDAQESVKKVEEQANNIDAATKKVEGIAKDVEKTAKKVEATSSDIEETAKKVESAAKDVDVTAKKVEATSNDVEETAKKVESAAKDVDVTAKKVEATSNDVEETAKKVESAAKEVDVTAMKVGVAPNRVSGSSINAADGSTNDVDARVKEVDSKVKDVETEVKEVGAKVKDFESKIIEVESRVKDFESKSNAKANANGVEGKHVDSIPTNVKKRFENLEAQMSELNVKSNSTLNINKTVNMSTPLTDLINSLSEQLKNLEKIGKVNMSFQNIIFKTGSAALTQSSYNLLDQIAAELKSSPNWNTVIITGHTDDTGSVLFNRSLSKARALTVKKYFISKGIDAARMTCFGLGEDMPIATNSTSEGKALNRRVEFEISK